MSSDNSNINTPDNSSDNSIDSETFYTPIAAIHPLNMADINADVDNDDVSNNPVNTPMTLESLAQIVINGFAEFREANANLKLESKKNDERLKEVREQLSVLDPNSELDMGLIEYYKGIEKMISNVVIGDKVLSYSPHKNTFLYSQVIAIPHQKNNKINKLTSFEQVSRDS
jgi:hypothetical protein